MTIRETLRSSWPLRALLVVLLIRLGSLLLGPDLRSLPLMGFLDVAVNLVLVATLGYVLFILLVRLQRRLLWRVRRRLILSYVFIGLIPVVLVVAFFLLAAIVTGGSVGSFVVQLSLDEMVTEAGSAARAAANELDNAPRGAAARTLARYQRTLSERNPDASVALIGSTVDRSGSEVTAGPWAHGTPPEIVPAWLVDGAFEGMIAVRDRDDVRIAARATAVVRTLGEPRIVVVDLPVGDRVVARIAQDTGVEVQEVSLVAAAPDEIESSVDATTSGTASTIEPRAQPTSLVGGLSWPSSLEYTDWTTGAQAFLTLEIGAPLALFTRVLGVQERSGDVGLGDAILVALQIVGGLFLIIEITALVMGFALAKSITGSVHELFVGTEHVRRGELSHRIRIRTRDQLGELGESFNAMTSSVKDALQQAAEKKRLEEELRIARDIQMSLLPRDMITIPGLAVTAVCRPAREVGGDYYDFIRLGARRLGVLVADVSGKGTSAAFYMAELKGVVLSLSQIYHSPRDLLIEVNRIIAAHMDSKSFITMTYAVIDLDTQTLTYARAGHTPLIYLPRDGGPGGAQVLSPSGLVVGLGGLETRFEELLEEHSLSIGAGDLAVLFTDGITEAMNEDADLFGEDRLSLLIEEHRDLSSDELRERILSDVEVFVGAANQHDDMTMVLLKVEERATVPTASMSAAAVGE